MNNEDQLEKIAILCFQDAVSLIFPATLSRRQGLLRSDVELTGRVAEDFNIDQGRQLANSEWIGRLEHLGVKISMDGRGRWMGSSTLRHFAAS